MSQSRSTLAGALALVILCASTSPASALLSPNVLRGGSAALQRITSMQTARVDAATPALGVEDAPSATSRDALSPSRLFEAQLVTSVSRLVDARPPRAIVAQLEGVLPRTVVARLMPLLGGA